jgi:transcriptional regulator with XRE-family HTH domain
MTNKEKFLALVSEQDTGTLERNRERIRNRAMLRESQQIALKVLMKLDELGWTQKDLAKAMEVSPQQITKIISGKENLTIETQIKLQNILDIPVLASYYENKMIEKDQWVFTVEKSVARIEPQVFENSNNFQSTKVLKLVRADYSLENYQA